jgi:hypothetical protein
MCSKRVNFGNSSMSWSKSSRLLTLGSPQYWVPILGVKLLANWRVPAPGSAYPSSHLNFVTSFQSPKVASLQFYHLLGLIVLYEYLSWSLLWVAYKDACILMTASLGLYKICTSLFLKLWQNLMKSRSYKICKPLHLSFMD